MNRKIFAALLAAVMMLASCAALAENPTAMPVPEMTMSPASITATASFIRFRPTFTRSTLVAGACHGNFRAIGLLYDGHRRPCPAVPVGRWPS